MRYRLDIYLPDITAYVISRGGGYVQGGIFRHLSEIQENLFFDGQAPPTFTEELAEMSRPA